MDEMNVENLENFDVSDIKVQDIVTIKDASKILGITVEGVWYYVNRGRLRLIKIGGINFVMRKDLTNLKRKKKL